MKKQPGSKQAPLSQVCSKTRLRAGLPVPAGPRKADRPPGVDRAAPEDILFAVDNEKKPE